VQPKFEGLGKLAETRAHMHELGTLSMRCPPRQRLAEVVDSFLVQAKAVLLVRAVDEMLDIASDIGR